MFYSEVSWEFDGDEIVVSIQEQLPFIEDVVCYNVKFKRDDDCYAIAAEPVSFTKDFDSAQDGYIGGTVCLLTDMLPKSVLEMAAERRPFLLHKQKICCTIDYIGYWRIEMKYSKDGTIYDLRRCREYWIVVSFYTPFFGKEIGKGSEAAMKAFYELLTKDGGDAVGFEYNGVKAVLPKIEMFVEDKIEKTGLLKRIEGCANQPCESMIQQEILDRLSGYTEKDVVLAGCGGSRVPDKTSQRIRGLLSLLRYDDKCYLGWDVAKKKDRTGYSYKSKIPSQTKSSCGLGKAQKEFMARLGVLQ